MKRAAGAAAAPGRPPTASRGAPTKPLAAYVLHRYDWSETSLIVDLFTRERGRLAVAAKGAKRPYSQLRGVLLPFQRLHVTLARGGGEAEVHTLRSAEWAGGAPMLAGSALFAGFYLNVLLLLRGRWLAKAPRLRSRLDGLEARHRLRCTVPRVLGLLRLLARQDAHALLFDAYAQTLPLLAAAGDDSGSQAALRAFELSLLREIGVLPELDSVTQTLQPVQPQAAYALHAESGIVPAPPGQSALCGAQWVALQAALQHGSLAALQAECRGMLPLLRPGLRALLQYHLGPYTLRTRQMLAELRNFAATTAAS